MHIRTTPTKLNGLARLISGTILATITLLALSASAQSEYLHEVTLSSLDGKVELTGEIIDVKDESYILKNTAGTYQISANRVRCAGIGCPKLLILPPVIAAPENLALASQETVR